MAEDKQEETAQEECLDDITLPPGGLGHHLGSASDGPLAQADYVTPQGRDLRIDLLRGYFVVR